MKKRYTFLVSLAVVASSLTSCSRSNYIFNTLVPAYLGSQSMPARVEAPVMAAAAAPAIAEAAATPAIVAVRPTTVVKVAAATTRPTLVQRLVLKRLASQVVKMRPSQQNAARVAKPASATGRAGLVILVGLVILLIGGLIGGTNIVATIGAVTFLVGLVLLILALVKG